MEQLAKNYHKRKKVKRFYHRVHGEHGVLSILLLSVTFVISVVKILLKNGQDMRINDYPRTAMICCTLIASAMALMCLCACDDDGDDSSSATENSTDSRSSDSSTEESNIPDARSEDAFAIVYPASGSVVNSSPTLPITIRGVGLPEEPTSFTVTVTTDKDYLQPHGARDAAQRRHRGVFGRSCSARVKMEYQKINWSAVDRC
jgi:hypothetical protein